MALETPDLRSAMKPFLQPLWSLRAFIKDHGSCATSMLQSVFAGLKEYDGFTEAFPSFDSFEGIYKHLMSRGDELWNSRKGFYEKSVLDLVAGLQQSLKSIPELNMNDIESFVKASKAQEKQLLKGCDGAADLIAGLEADVAEFGLQNHSDLCKNKPVSRQEI